MVIISHIEFSICIQKNKRNHMPLNHINYMKKFDHKKHPL